jgi:hypothetical protein
MSRGHHDPRPLSQGLTLGFNLGFLMTQHLTQRRAGYLSQKHGFNSSENTIIPVRQEQLYNAPVNVNIDESDSKDN